MFKNFVSREEFFEALYRDKLKDVFIDEKKYDRNTFVVYEDKIQQKKCKDAAKVALHSAKWGTYFTPSVYYHYRFRAKDRVIWMMMIVLDFDFCKPGKTPEYYTPDEVAQRVRNEFGYNPHFVWRTGHFGNYQAALIIEPMCGVPYSIWAYETVCRGMARATGADVNATNANNLYRAPKDEIYCFADPKVPYDFDVFKRWYFDEFKPIEDKELAKSNVVSLEEEALLRHIAIQKLMTCDILGFRNYACFTLALLFKALGRTQEETEEFILDEWIQNANDPAKYGRDRFGVREARKTIRSAFKGKWKGPSAGYITMLTGVEFHYRVRRYTYERKVFFEGYKKKAQLVSAVVNFLRENNGSIEHVTYDQLAEATNIPLRSLKREIPKLKNDGVIDYVSSKGGHGGGGGLVSLTLIVDGIKGEFEGTDIRFSNAFEEAEFLGMLDELFA